MTRSGVWLTIVALAFAAVAACTAPAEPPAVAIADAVAAERGAPRGRDLSPEARARCVADGGFVQRAGMLGYEGCYRRFKDGGKSCSDGAQCLAGRCDYKTKGDGAKGDGSKGDGAKGEGTTSGLTGQCARDDIPFGCRQSLTGGHVSQSICVD